MFYCLFDDIFFLIMENSLSAMFQTEVLTVTQLTNIVKNLLERNIPFVTLEGEISNYKPSSTGHVYFSLKDSNAVIAAVMFRNNVSKLNFLPRDGALVKVTGSISVYASRGNYQIVVTSMEQAGTGTILQLLEEKKRQFAQEGIFDQNRKRPIPFYSNTIGVVTSPTGAALRDILQITQRRNPKAHIIILPCTVQGSDAGYTIAKQIEIANIHHLCDVLIVGRGGGSLEDLLPFSEECVVRAIAASKIPVISAVGHEIDWALSDFVADIRAPTPSAAAELANPILSEILNFLEDSKTSLEHSIVTKTDKMRLLIKNFSPESLELRFRNIEQPLLSEFDDAKEALLDAMQKKIDAVRKEIEEVNHLLELGNPKTILARGYSMVRDTSTGKVVRSPNDTKKGNTLQIIPANGIIEVTVI